ncbi:MAG: hypothetical protein ACOYYU_05865 [Chloroflexota bacterium]
MPEKILFICGSLNQTKMMHKIAQNMGEYDSYFTPYYADGIEDAVARMGLLDFTVLGGRHRRETEDYLAKNGLLVDWRGERHDYDLVITCSDLIVQRNIRGKRLVLVQEGITEPESPLYHFVKRFKLPRYLANTSTNGLSDAYDLFCVASHGYRDLFIRKGVRPEKIAVTGIPNFDNLQENLENVFPFRDFVLVATTPYRESFRYENRAAFLQQCVKIAAGRPMIFKLHPVENARRARREIMKVAPDALVLEYGNVDHMIAKASVVITQQSTCTFVAAALQKEVYTYLDINELRRLMPIQNEGSSARRIASLSRRVLHTPMHVLEQVRKGNRRRPKWEQADAY